METFRLAIVGADETVPRVLVAQGKGCGGDMVLVLAPTRVEDDVSGLLVHAARSGGAIVVRAWEGKAGIGPRELRERPWEVAAALEQLRRLRAAGEALPPGPVVLKNRWQGVLTCKDGVPVVTLQRRIASYAAIQVQSDPKTGRWVPTVELAARWFVTPQQTVLTPEPSLLSAVSAALTAATVGVARGCSVRDTTRRESMDPAYAAGRPKRTADKPSPALGKGLAKAASQAPAAPAAKAPAAKAPTSKAPTSKDPAAPAPKTPAAPAAKAPAPKTPAAPAAKAPAPKAPAAPAAKAPAARPTRATKDRALLDAFAGAVAEVAAQLGAKAAA